MTVTAHTPMYVVQANTAVLSWKGQCLRIWWELVLFHDIYVVGILTLFYHLLGWDCVTFSSIKLIYTVKKYKFNVFNYQVQL